MNTTSPPCASWPIRSTPGHGRFAALKKIGGRLADLPRTFLLLRGVDVLVVPGTGVLERTPDVKPWGLPYWLFLATLACRLRGGRVALVCVGADPPASRATRWLYRTTVSLADHCSYRDPESREAMAALGSTHLRVRPATTLRSRSLRPRAPMRTLAVWSWGSCATRGPRTIPAVARRGSRTTSPPSSPSSSDSRPAAGRSSSSWATRGTGRSRPRSSERAPWGSGGGRRSQVRVSPAASLDAIMREMAGADLVVATRFHHLVCSLKMLRPTVSIGYAAKSEHLMARFGLGDYALVIEELDPSELWQAAEDVQSRRRELEPVMRHALAQVMEDLECHMRALPLGELSRSRS